MRFFIAHTIFLSFLIQHGNGKATSTRGTMYRQYPSRWSWLAAQDRHLLLIICLAPSLLDTGSKSEVQLIYGEWSCGRFQPRQQRGPQATLETAPQYIMLSRRFRD